jgi:uncharacterized membrane protein YdcZ (DUF606 family)
MRNQQKRKWLVSGALGCILVGTGFSIGVEASHWKHRGEDWWIWVGGGTLGIAILIVGIITLINSRSSG